jgi:hypothetical protein
LSIALQSFRTSKCELFKIQVFWCVTPCRLANSYSRHCLQPLETSATACSLWKRRQELTVATALHRTMFSNTAVRISEFVRLIVVHCYYYYYCVGRGSSVGIATRYRLDDPGIESRWGRDFQPPSRPTLGPTQPPVQWVPGHSGVKRPGRGVAHPPPLGLHGPF